MFAILSTEKCELCSVRGARNLFFSNLTLLSSFTYKVVHALHSTIVIKVCIVCQHYKRKLNLINCQRLMACVQQIG